MTEQYAHHINIYIGQFIHNDSVNTFYTVPELSATEPHRIKLCDLWQTVTIYHNKSQIYNR